MEQDNFEILYHYTDFYGLNGILGLNGEGIRLYNSRYMNDPYEMKFYLKLIKNNVLKKFNKNDSKYHFANTVLDDALVRFSDYDEYIFSLSSENKDVNMWVRYANDAKGVVIGFNKTALDKISQKNKIFLKNVEYLEDSRTLEDTNFTYSVKVDEIVKIIKESNDINEVIEKVFTTINSVISTATLFKQKFYSSEKETRLKTHSNMFKTNLTTKFDIRKDCIKDYLVFDWKKECLEMGIGVDELIKEIIIGSNSLTTVNDLHKWLKYNELESLTNCVRKSDYQYR